MKRPERTMRTILLLGAALSAPALAGAQATSVAASAQAQPQPQTQAVKAFDISAQSLSKALLEFSRQADLIVTVSPDLVKGRHAPAIRGELAPMAALTKLLEGTGLHASRSAGGGITIVPAATSMTGMAGPAMQLAQAPAAETPMAVSEMQAVAEEPPAGKGIPEILVKGAKFSINADIQRTESDIQPYVIYTAEEIQSSMAMNLEDFFKMRLPMQKLFKSTNGTGTNSQGRTSGSNQSAINLRGLGVDETLVLINGRRVPGVSAVWDSDTDATGAFNQPDLNGIALNQIERIEVLPSTASGIYGGGATGGVINIILKTDYAGVQTAVDYANVFDTDAGTLRVSVNGGFSLEGGRTSISLSGSYSDANAMAGRDRDFSVRARRMGIQNNPEQYFHPFAQVPLGYTTNIRSVEYNGDFSGFSNLVLDDGTPLGAPTTYVPVGYAGVASDNAQALVNNAGDFNLDLSDDLNGLANSQGNHPRTWSTRISVNREFSDRFSMFADLMHSMNNGRVHFAQLQNSAQLPADSPGNPFQQAIQVVFPLPGLAFLSTNESESINGIVGAALRLPGGWNLQAEFNQGRSTSTSVGGAAFRSGAVTAALEDGTLNVLRDLNLDPLDLGAYALDYPTSRSVSKSYMSGGTARVSGPILDLPGGAMTLSGSLSRNKQRSPDALLKNYVEFLGGEIWVYEPARSSVMDSLYVETFAPLVSDRNARPGLRVLELQASFRRDDYTIRQGRVPGDSMSLPAPEPLPEVVHTKATTASNGYTMGLRYGPAQDVVLRASYSYGFKPPSVGQIAPSLSYDAYFYDEDLGQLYQIPTVVRGGNPDLSPEDSDSISAGLILTPSALAGLRLSVDYTHIKKNGEIASLWDGLIADNADLFPGRVERDPDTGRITFLDSSLVNIDYSVVEAYDIQADYRFQTRRGTFNLYALATHNTRFERKLTASSSLDEYVGFLDGPLDWSGNLGLTWRQGPWMLGWNMQYYNDYFVYNASDSDSPAQIESVSRTQGSPKIPSQHYHDISFRYSFGAAPGFAGRFLANTEISGGIQNVFDTLPPPFVVSGTLGYSAYGDARLRRYTLQVRRDF